MRRVLAPLLVVIAMAARGEAQQTSKPTSAATFISGMYDTYAGATHDDPHVVGLFVSPVEVMRRYMGKHLVDAVLADIACTRRERGECNLSFDPMWATNDPGGVTVRVVPTKDSTVVEAHLRRSGDDKATVVTYHVERTKAGWRIADMSGPGWPSLVKLLRGPMGR